jgi:hypothetical protein
MDLPCKSIYNFSEVLLFIGIIFNDLDDFEELTFISFDDALLYAERNFNHNEEKRFTTE